MLDRLDVPDFLHRNVQRVSEVGYEVTGQCLIDLATRNAGLHTLADTDVLDVGCGVRFAMTIINRKVAIKSYTGIEVNLPIVEFLRTNVEAHDSRFRFAHWNVHNELYNAGGTSLSAQERLPVGQSFDLIWLFSVFTHLNPSDSLGLLKLARKQIRTKGKLFFSAFIDDDLDGFEDRVEDRPLLKACYGRSYLRSLIEEAGWTIESIHDKDPDQFIQHYIVASPS